MSDFPFCDHRRENGWNCEERCQVEENRSRLPSVKIQGGGTRTPTPGHKIKGSYGNNSWEAGTYTVPRPDGYVSPILAPDGSVVRMKEGTANRRKYERQIAALKAGKSLKEVQNLH